MEGWRVDFEVTGTVAAPTLAEEGPVRARLGLAGVGATVVFRAEYSGRSDLLLLCRLRQAGVILGAVRGAAVRSGAGRVWLVLAETGDRDPTWNQAMDGVGRIAPPQLPRLMVIDPGADAHRRERP